MPDFNLQNRRVKTFYNYLFFLHQLDFVSSPCFLHLPSCLDDNLFAFISHLGFVFCAANQGNHGFDRFCNIVGDCGELHWFYFIRFSISSIWRQFGPHLWRHNRINKDSRLTFDLLNLTLTLILTLKNFFSIFFFEIFIWKITLNLSI